MKTSDWVTLLATGAGVAPRAVVARRLGPAAALGLLVALGLALRWPWHDFSTGTQGAVLAAKLGFTVALAALALRLVAVLARPTGRPRLAALALTGLMAAAVLWSVQQLLAVPAGERAVLLQGGAWLGCALSVAVLAIPTLIGGLWALRGLAPTRPRLAGAAVGLMSGAVGALAYSVTCPQTSLVFVVLAYSVAMLAPVAAGAALGPRLLRW